MSVSTLVLGLNVVLTYSFDPTRASDQGDLVHGQKVVLEVLQIGEQAALQVFVELRHQRCELAIRRIMVANEGLRRAEQCIQGSQSGAVKVVGNIGQVAGQGIQPCEVDLLHQV